MEAKDYKRWSSGFLFDTCGRRNKFQKLCCHCQRPGQGNNLKLQVTSFRDNLSVAATHAYNPKVLVWYFQVIDSSLLQNVVCVMKIDLYFKESCVGALVISWYKTLTAEKMEKVLRAASGSSNACCSKNLVQYL